MEKTLVRSRRLTRPLLMAALALSACSTGNIGGKSEDPSDPAVTARALKAVDVTARRLSRAEYDATLADLLGDTTSSGFQQLPEDSTDPFDNNYKAQQVSPALIAAAETLATAAAERAVAAWKADATLRAKYVPCTPTGPDDAACLKEFIETFGRRALRRALTDAEVASYLKLGAFSVDPENPDGPDFDEGLELVIQTMLQEVRFLYRVEVGTAVSGAPGVFKLDDFEVASRLSYFLWGTMPDDELLDLAAAGGLSTPDEIRAAAATMLADPKARDRVDRFHALWLSYYQLPHPAELSSELRAETAALVNRVVFDEPSDYFDIFTADETFVNDDLADHYGLPKPGSATGAWVPYGDSGRKGILSHGSVLSAGAKFADTSPTQRGKFVRTHLLCQTIGAPPPGVKADAPPPGETSSSCKIDHYSEHATNGSCAGCHSLMDPIGFGLENYDKSGAYRTTEPDKPDCPIDGNGELLPLGAFKGPAALAELLIQSGELETCVVTQLYRFAMGRKEDGGDTPAIEELGERFAEQGHAFDKLMIEVVSSDGFGFRKQEDTP